MNQKSHVDIGVSYTSPFDENPQEKSREDTSVNRGGHATSTPRSILSPGKVVNRKVSSAEMCGSSVVLETKMMTHRPRNSIHHFWKAIHDHEATASKSATTNKPLILDQELKRLTLECIDRLQQETDTRCEGMECISDRFVVLKPSNLIETSETQLPKCVQSLVENCNELPADGILTEIPRLKRFLKAAKIPKEKSFGWTSLRFLEFVVEYELFDSVPNLT
ncbi:hypothetical protein AVEN_235269-1 [Araneus ventricosus]|uniref:Uncharacterized protein n=1 Tax=Araneus ventricosus TaxID=182803 RepID=A0A4Y2A3K0_ARAVE|nr:hypothetical protein AVEN_235269-1 [Araneus ventricosus]